MFFIKAYFGRKRKKKGSEILLIISFILFNIVFEKCFYFCKFWSIENRFVTLILHYPLYIFKLTPNFDYLKFFTCVNVLFSVIIIKKKSCTCNINKLFSFSSLLYGCLAGVFYIPFLLFFYCLFACILNKYHFTNVLWFFLYCENCYIKSKQCSL